MTEKKKTGTEVLTEFYDDVQAKGYRGTTVDPTPLEDYTLAGVTKSAAEKKPDSEDA